MHNAFNHHPTSKAKSWVRFWVNFQVSKFLLQSIFPLENCMMTLALTHPMFQVSVDSLITLQQFSLQNPCSHIVVLAKPKLQSVPSWNCRSYWNLEVYGRVPRLESNYVPICKLQPLYFVTSNFWRGLHYDWWKLCREHFCEVPKKGKKKKLFDGQNDIWQVLTTSILNTAHDPQHSSAPGACCQ
jgi:hypothetical protein